MAGSLSTAVGDRQTGWVTDHDVVSATRTVAAPAQDIFDLLATPARHREIDGSGSVRGVQPRTPERLSPGARFGMQMRIGLPYKILNEVVEFEEPSRIAWRHFGGHVWRYLLDPVDADHTRVTEQFDATGARAPMVLTVIRARSQNAKAINATLDRLQRWARDRR
jgi:uncharacterized protein YndB with AHSA1/START domain